jgi:hypothetical protein
MRFTPVKLFVTVCWASTAEAIKAMTAINMNFFMTGQFRWLL